MEKFDVAICGYGPVGATLSLLLAKYNYKVLIIEKNQGPCKTARAINTDGEQLRIFDQFNLAEKVISNSNQIEKVHLDNKENLESSFGTLGKLIWKIRSQCYTIRIRHQTPKKSKMTFRGTMVHSEVCNSGCFCLGSYIHWILSSISISIS